MHPTYTYLHFMLCGVKGGVNMLRQANSRALPAILRHQPFIILGRCQSAQPVDSNGSSSSSSSGSSINNGSSDATTSSTTSGSTSDDADGHSPVKVPSESLLAELRFLECEALKLRYREFAAETNGAAVPWREFKTAVDVAAQPVDSRVRTIFASLTLGFISQGIQFPVLPLLARSVGLGTADIGLVYATTACARLVTNVPATWVAERIGRRPCLVAGPLAASIGMLGLASSSCFEHLVVSNVCVGTGLATTMAGASLYLADVSTPRNRAQSTAPLLQSALLGFSIGPAIGGGLAQSLGVNMPFLACAAGLAASSAASALLLPETRDEVLRRKQRLEDSLQAQRDAQERLVHTHRGEAALGSDASGAASGPPPSDAVPSGSPVPMVIDDMTWRLMTRPALQGLGFHVFINGFSQGAFPVTLVLFAVEHMNMSSASVGAMLTANVLVMVVTTAPATQLSDHVTSRKSIMVPAMAASAVFTGLQPLAASPYQFAGLVGCAGFASAISMPSISPLILDSTTADERPRALAGRQMMQDLGTLLGASSMGLVASVSGIPAAMETVALLQGLAVGWFALRVPRAPAKKPTSPDAK